MSQERFCVDCSLAAPSASTAYTLIGSGWRVSKRSDSRGAEVIEWRCRKCWQKRKSDAPASGDGVPGAPLSARIRTPRRD